MTTGSDVVLLERGVLALEGEETRAFLQGLISNDIEKVTRETAIFAALLTPQGKYLFDFMIAQQDDRLLLEVEAARLPALSQRLAMYKLRAKVDITDVSGDFKALALLGALGLNAFDVQGEAGAAVQFEGGVVFIDPRLKALGGRALLPSGSVQRILDDKGLKAAEASDYTALRHQWGVPEGSQDLAVDKATLLESGFEELNGVDFEKGCFVGQELTARMKYRALVKKRLMPITFDGTPPDAGVVVKAGDREIGEIRSAENGRGLALLRLDRLADVKDQGTPLTAGGITVMPETPDWANFVLAGQA